MVGTARPRKHKQTGAARFFLDREGRLRERALFDLAPDSKLGDCDLVKTRTGDLGVYPLRRLRMSAISRSSGGDTAPMSTARRSG